MIFFSFPNKSWVMKGEDTVSPQRQWLSTSLLRASFSVVNELEFSTELTEVDFSDQRVKKSERLFFMWHVEGRPLVLWLHQLSQV